MVEAEVKSYKKFSVWQQAHLLAQKVYEVTKKFPKEEQYGITSQLRRAALSVPCNIVEGSGRQGQKELKHFLNIALGSLLETEYLLEFAKDIGYLDENEYHEIELLRNKVGARLWNFYRAL